MSLALSETPIARRSIYKHVCIFSGEKHKQTNIHLQQPFYLLTKTWKYGGRVFGKEVAGGAQSNSIKWGWNIFRFNNYYL